MPCNSLVYGTVQGMVPHTQECCIVCNNRMCDVVCCLSYQAIWLVCVVFVYSRKVSYCNSLGSSIVAWTSLLHLTWLPFFLESCNNFLAEPHWVQFVVVTCFTINYIGIDQGNFSHSMVNGVIPLKAFMKILTCSQHLI